MPQTRNLLSQYLAGSWLSQKNVYIIKNKTQKIFKDKISLFSIKIQKNIKKYYHMNISKIYKLNIQNNQNIVSLDKQILLDNNIDVSIKELDMSIFKVNYNIQENNLVYEEYIYAVSNNLIFSSGILKDTRYDQYLGIIIGSYIKLKD